MNRNRTISFFTIVFGVFFLILKAGNTLRCYECNSHTNKACLEPKNNTNVSIVDCDAKNSKSNFIACRKVLQIIDFEVNGLPPDERVIRSCAFERQDTSKCYQRSGFGGRQEVCACEGPDLCNNSNVHRLNYGVLFASLIFLGILGSNS